MAEYEFAASFAQQRLWFMDQLVPGTALYHVTTAMPLKVALPPERIIAALRTVVGRHEALRTALHSTGAEPVQVVYDEVQVEVRQTDLTHLSPPERETRLDQLCVDDANEPIRLDSAPLWRARLVRLGPADWRLVFIAHHAIFDAASAPNMWRELTELCQSEVDRRPASLPELAIQYADFAAWQRESVATQDHLGFWRERLAGIPEVHELPTDRPRPAGRSYRGGEIRFTVPERIRSGVHQLARACGATPFMVLLSAYAALVSRLSGQPDVVVGSPVSVRELPELNPLIGMFVNTVLHRVSLTGDPSFVELVARVRDGVLAAWEHQAVPFEMLVETLAPQRDTSRTPLYQLGFNYLTGVGSEDSHGTAKLDLQLDLADVDGILGGRVEYALDLFDEATAASFAERLQLLLTHAIAEPATSIGALRIMGARERAQALAQPAVPAGEPATLPERIARHATVRPDAVAVVDSAGKALTYAALLNEAEELAIRLRKAGAGADRPVALLLEPTAEAVVAVVGCWLAGSAYLPLDPQHPQTRRAFQLADARAVAIVSEGLVVERIAASDGRLGEPSREALAYVIYTSGSTGSPKGVGVTQANLASYVDSLQGLIAPAPGRRFAMLQPLTFDFGITMLAGALGTGGTLYLATRDLAADADWVAALIAREEIDYLKLSPSHLTALRAARNIVDLLPRKALLLGGEASRWADVAGLRAFKPGCAVINHYGPTETTVGAVALPGETTPAAPGATTPIGRPLAHAQAYVLDMLGEPVPLGVVGELYLGGSGVARGYLDRPALTASRFVPDPFSGQPGARLYRTGDRARRLPDGLLEFCGRVDDQAKVRGYRVEPGEVRYALLEHPEVTDAAVIVDRAGTPQARLIGYVTGPAQARLPQLREWLGTRVPEYLVPSALVALEALPLAGHGKLDRSALPSPEAQETAGSEEPAGMTEEIIAGLYASLLNRSRVGRGDGFFALGGHSLLATRLIARLRSAFEVELPLRAVFESPTVAGLAERVAAAQRESAPPLPAVRRVSREAGAPASFGQRRLWFLDQLDPGGPLYNTNVVVRATGAVEAEVLRACLSAVVERHDVLRTRFVAAEDDVMQIVEPRVDIPFRTVDLSALPEPNRSARKTELFAAETAVGFDLATAPPLRALLVKLASDELEMLLTLHHTVSDNSSAGVLLREISEVYPRLRSGNAEPLPPLPVQYADFAVWQRELVADLRHTQLAYWREHLAGLPPKLELPTDRPRQALAGIEGAHHNFDLPGEVADRLRALAAQEGASLFMALHAAFAALLGRYADTADVPVGVPYITRRRPELEPLIGFFVNTLVLRTDLSGEPSFRELLRRVRSETLGAYANADVPFEALVEELAPRRDLSGSPLVQALIMLDDSDDAAAELGDVNLRWETFAGTIARFDLSFFAWRRSDHLEASLQYRTDLFDRTTVERIAGHLAVLLERAVADPDRPLPDLVPITATDTSQIGLWNDTGRVLAGPLVPVAVAANADPVFVSRVRRMAGWLRSRGVGPEVVVGICMERGPDLVVAVHAVLAAGGAYLPLEPSLPVGRRELMVRDAGAVLVVTEVVLGEVEVGVVVPDPESLAYVIFTSGSTGRPKGVGVSHRAIANRLYWMQSVFPLVVGERVLFKTPFSFDVSVWELCWPLMVGAELVIAKPSGQADPDYLARLITDERVSTVHFVPSMLEAFLAADPPSGLRQVICSGEALPPELVRRFHERLPGVQLHNLYGPTEAAVDVSWHGCVPGEVVTPIGVPVANTRLEVLDAGMRRVPVGVPGELFLGGVQLARGYVNQPGLTAQRFVPDPFGESGQRLYRTGDRARWLPNGEVEYLGRLDRQVKLRGLRIELGEIEAALRQLPGVKSAAVAVHSGRITGYVVADELPQWKPPLQRTLPDYMVPGAVLRLDALPVTANGKLDVSALPIVEGRALQHRPVETAAERAVAHVWTEVLGVQDIGLDDNFFDLGGDSIRCLKVIARLRAAGYRIELRQLVMHQTLAELAADLTAAPPQAAPSTAAFGLLAPEDLAKLLSGGGGA